MVLGKMIHTQIAQKGWSLATLARRSGVPKTTIHGWTTGRAVQDLNQLRKVASILEVSVHYLIFGCEDPHSRAVRNPGSETGGNIAVISAEGLKQVFNGHVRVIIESRP